MEPKADYGRATPWPPRVPSPNPATPAGSGARAGYTVGLDIGTRFIYATAWDERTERLVAHSRAPTGHDQGSVGINLAGALRQVVEATVAAGADGVRLVTHSTTRPLANLLRTDAVPAGLLDLRPKRTRRWGDAVLAAIPSARATRERSLNLIHEELEVDGDPDELEIRETLNRLALRGAKSIWIRCTPEVGDRRHREIVLTAAAELGIPAAATFDEGDSDRGGRKRTAVVTAVMAPEEALVADAVQSVVDDLLPQTPLFRVTGDGHATSPAFGHAAGAATSVGGVAAPIIGVLGRRHVSDAVLVDVGDTTTKVSRLVDGVARLASVQMFGLSTGIGGVDSHVIGVGGGSLMRFGRWRRRRIVSIGPRSAASAQVLSCAFASPELLAGAQVTAATPVRNDASRYPTLESRSGVHLAVTLTCAAAALEKEPEIFYPSVRRGSAVLGLKILAEALTLDWRDLAHHTLEAGTRQIENAVLNAMNQPGASRPYLLGVGGAAGALVPVVARRLGLLWLVPGDAELMSSLGGGLSADLATDDLRSSSLARDRSTTPKRQSGSRGFFQERARGRHER